MKTKTKKTTKKVAKKSTKKVVKKTAKKTSKFRDQDVSISAPTDERRIVLNRAKCADCGDIIISHHQHDYVTCKCGKSSVDGGCGYLRRAYKSTPPIDMSVYSDAPFEEVREVFERGGRGKDG